MHRPAATTVERARPQGTPRVRRESRTAAIQLALVVTAVLSCAGCLQMSFLVSVGDDGSGTITVRTMMNDQLRASYRRTLARGGTDADDPLSESRAKSMAASFGPGVTYDFSVPVNETGWAGRQAVYDFTRIEQVRIGAGDTTAPPAADAMSSPALPGVAFSFLHPAAAALVRVHMTPPSVFGAPGSFSAFANPDPKLLADIRTAIAGARITVALQPVGRIVRSSSADVRDGRVVLFEADLDRLLRNDAFLRFEPLKTTDDWRRFLGLADGLSMSTEPDIDVEFLPQPLK